MAMNSSSDKAAARAKLTGEVLIAVYIWYVTSVTFEFWAIVAAVPKSDNPSAKAIRPAAKIAGKSSGILILNHARHVGAPDKRAASSNSDPSQCSAAVTAR